MDGEYPSVPKNHIVVAGNYNDSNVTQQGADARLADCLLSVHIYAIGSTDTSESNWTSALKNAVGAYATRTVVSEYGAPMTDGLTIVVPSTATHTSPMRKGSRVK